MTMFQHRVFLLASFMLLSLSSALGKRGKLKQLGLRRLALKGGSGNNEVSGGGGGMDASKPKNAGVEPEGAGSAYKELIILEMTSEDDGGAAKDAIEGDNPAEGINDTMVNMFEPILPNNNESTPQWDENSSPQKGSVAANVQHKAKKARDESKKIAKLAKSQYRKTYRSDKAAMKLLQSATQAFSADEGILLPPEGSADVRATPTPVSSQTPVTASPEVPIEETLSLAPTALATDAPLTTTNAPHTDPPIDVTQASVSLAPMEVTDPPVEVTDPPLTDPPIALNDPTHAPVEALDPPASEAPVTETTATEVPATETPEIDLPTPETPLVTSAPTPGKFQTDLDIIPEEPAGTVETLETAAPTVPVQAVVDPPTSSPAEISAASDAPTVPTCATAIQIAGTLDYNFVFADREPTEAEIKSVFDATLSYFVDLLREEYGDLVVEISGSVVSSEFDFGPPPKYTMTFEAVVHFSDCAPPLEDLNDLLNMSDAQYEDYLTEYVFPIEPAGQHIFVLAARVEFKGSASYLEV